MKSRLPEQRHSKTASKRTSPETEKERKTKINMVQNFDNQPQREQFWAVGSQLTETNNAFLLQNVLDSTRPTDTDIPKSELSKRFCHNIKR